MHNDDTLLLHYFIAFLLCQGLNPVPGQPHEEICGQLDTQADQAQVRLECQNQLNEV